MDKTLIKIPTTVKLSKNYDINEFLNNFIIHNPVYFNTLIKEGYTQCPNDYTCPADTGGILPGIHYETGKWKWGSVGLMNKMIKKGFVTIVKDHNNDCYCLDATPKLVTKILKAVNKYLGNC